MLHFPTCVPPACTSSSRRSTRIAEDLGVFKAHIWEIETGRSRNPDIELVRKLAEHFSVGIAFLTCNGEGGEQDPAALQFFREFGGDLSSCDWETLRTVAERLKDR